MRSVDATTHANGQMLADTEKAKCSNGQLNGRDSSGGSVIRPLEKIPKTLSEMGVSKDQSSKWQKLAAIPDQEFEIGYSHSKIIYWQRK
jgi:hypothetical protein